MLPPQIILLPDLVNPHNPALGRKRLLEGIEFGSVGRECRATDPVDGLASGEELVVVVVGHFVHEGIAHCGGCFVVDFVVALGGEKVFFFDFVGPDAFGDADHPEKLQRSDWIDWGLLPC